MVDAWGVKAVQPRMQGRCFLTRCAEDCLIGFALAADARRGMEVLPQRCDRVRLTMHPAKTVVVACKKPPGRERAAHGKGTVDLLGLTHSWATSRRGDWVIKRTTVGKRLRRCLQALWTGCRANRQAPWQEPERT